MTSSSTRRDVADRLRECIELVPRRPVGELPRWAGDDGAASSWSSYLRNYCGKTFARQLARSWSQWLDSRNHSLVPRRATRTLVALRLYHDTHGRLPESLEDLVSPAFPAVPRDPYDGRAIRYDPERRLLYSVGDDGVDHGGIAPYPETGGVNLGGEDRTVAVPFGG